MMLLLSGTGLRSNDDAIPSGAQTERRGGAGPVRGLLGGKDLTGRLVRQLFPTANGSGVSASPVLFRSEKGPHIAPRLRPMNLSQPSVFVPRLLAFTGAAPTVW